MVDELHNVGEGRPVAAYGENNDVVKQQLQERKVNVPMTGGPAKDERRGTSVQHSSGSCSTHSRFYVVAYCVSVNFCQACL